MPQAYTLQPSGLPRVFLSLVLPLVTVVTCPLLQYAFLVTAAVQLAGGIVIFFGLLVSPEEIGEDKRACTGGWWWWWPFFPELWAPGLGVLRWDGLTSEVGSYFTVGTLAGSQLSPAISSLRK